MILYPTDATLVTSIQQKMIPGLEINRSCERTVVIILLVQIKVVYLFTYGLYIGPEMHNYGWPSYNAQVLSYNHYLNEPSFISIHRHWIVLTWLGQYLIDNWDN